MRFLQPNSNLKVEFHCPVVVDVVMVHPEWCYGPGKSNQLEREVRLRLSMEFDIVDIRLVDGVRHCCRTVGRWSSTLLSYGWSMEFDIVEENKLELLRTAGFDTA